MRQRCVYVVRSRRKKKATTKMKVWGCLTRNKSCNPPFCNPLLLFAPISKDESTLKFKLNQKFIVAAAAHYIDLKYKVGSERVALFSSKVQKDARTFIMFTQLLFELKITYY